MNASWQLQEAKASLSQVLREAKTHGPQIITVHGKEEGVVISMAEYKQFKKPTKKPSLAELCRNSPAYGLELEFERDKSLPREEDLF